MPYIGTPLRSSFSSIPSVQQFNGDGSTTGFTLAQAVTSDQDILVSVDGVIQDAAAYSVSGTTLTFSAAPASGTASIFVNYLNLASGSLVPADENKGTFQAGSIFRTNVQTLSIDTTITATTNANATGPLGVADGITLTIASGGRLVIV
jgi:hypothetical protein